MTGDADMASSVLCARRVARCFITISVVLLSIFAKGASTNGKSIPQTNRSK